MFRRSGFVIIFLLGIPMNSLAAPDLAGTFGNADLSITLQLQERHFTGTVTASGGQFPVVLQVSQNAEIQGYYIDQLQQFPIVGSVRENGLYLLIDGTEFFLTKQNESVPVTSGAPVTPSNAPLTVSRDEVGDKSLGFKFTAPAGWEAQSTGSGYLLGSRTEQGFILVLMHAYSTVAQLKSAAQEGLADANGINLQVNGAARPFGSGGITVDFSGRIQSQAARGRAISLLSPFGGGITIMGATGQAAYSDNFAGYVESIAQTVVFARPEIPPVAEQWRQQLSNCRLTYLWSYYSGGTGDGSYVGESQQTTIDLCAQGFFRFSDNNQMAVDGGNTFGANASGFGGGSNQGNGTWKIAAQGLQPVLVLTFYDGRVQEYRLSQQDGKTFLDDKRFFLTYANDSNPEYRPVCR